LLARQLVRWQLQLVQLSLEAQQILMLMSAVCGIHARADHHGQKLGGDELMRGFHLWLCIQHDPHAAFTFGTVQRVECAAVGATAVARRRRQTRVDEMRLDI
jgi:hypothetical protein